MTISPLLARKVLTTFQRMISIGPEQLIELLDFPRLIDAIRSAFSTVVDLPERHQHTIEVPDAEDATLLIMPAWIPGEYIGIKSATIFPSNGKLNRPSVSATYLLLDGRTGEPLATIDGKTLTSLRTAATSALASSYLSRTDSELLLMVGCGTLAAPLIRAHATVRQIRSVTIWNRTLSRARELGALMSAEGFHCNVTTDLDSATKRADIISCATLSRTPLIRGCNVRSGTHVDLVGSFTPHMRESDTALIARSDVFVDTYAGAAEEAGDLILAASDGNWDLRSIRADLHQLINQEKPGRSSDDAVTVFKSVGCALEDLAAAKLAFEQLNHPLQQSVI